MNKKVTMKDLQVLPTAPEIARDPQALMRAIQPLAQEMPSQNVRADRSPAPPATAVRVKKTIYYPEYLYEQLRLRAFQNKESINSLVLKALKRDGYDVKEEDLIERQ
jgi:hypothetical protein